MIYRRGKSGTWWIRFRFANRMIHESARTTSKTLARAAERQRRRELEQKWNRVETRTLPPTLAEAAKGWLSARKNAVTESTGETYTAALKKLCGYLGNCLICDISAYDIGQYQQLRLAHRAAAATINKEVGCLRAILKKFALWAAIQSDVKMLRENQDAGKALEPEEEARLLQAASQIGHTGHHQGHWSPIYIVSQLGLNTGLRKSEVTRLRWCELDLQRKLITRIALSKSDAGIGRFIPLNQPACAALKLWAARFPNHKAEHYVFPACENGKIDPRRPVMNWRTAWKKVCAVAGMPGLRFHDLRHTAATKLLENGVPYPVVAQILGWSPTTAVRMAKRYGHIRPEIQRRALDGIATQPLGAPAIVHQIDNRIGTLLKSTSPQVVESISVGA